MTATTKKQQDWVTYVHNLILREAIKEGMPKHYQDDLLVYDKEQLQELPIGTKFIWILRECGTHMIGNTMWGKGVTKYYQNNPDVIFYYYDGQSLNKVSGDEAYEIVNLIQPWG